MAEKFNQAEVLKAEQSIKNNLSLEQHWAKKLEDYENQYKDQENFQKMLEDKYMEVLK